MILLGRLLACCVTTRSADKGYSVWIKTEENHTKEALAAEDREASLRETLAQTEKKLADLHEFVESADEQISCAREERDAARVACRASQSELEGLKSSHANLQKALESLERGMNPWGLSLLPNEGFLIIIGHLSSIVEKQAEANAEAQHFRMENKRLQAEASDLGKKVKELQASSNRQEELQAANRALHSQLERHTGRLSEAHSQGELYMLQILNDHPLFASFYSPSIWRTDTGP